MKKHFSGMKGEALAGGMPLQAILFNDTSPDEHHGCQVVMRQIRTLAQGADINIVYSCPMRFDWEASAWLKKQIERVDICIVNGEGTMHDDAPAAMVLGRLALFCMERGIPCFLINSVWQNNERLNQYAPYFSRVFVRDVFSERELKRIGVSAQVVPDLTLSLDNWHSDKPRKGWILNGSVIPDVHAAAWSAVYRKGYDKTVYMSIRTLAPIRWHCGVLRERLKSILRRAKSYRHIVTSYMTRYPESLTRKKYSRLRWRHATLSTDRFLGRISEAEGVITGRFHMVTLCLITKTPFFALASNTFKIQGMLGEMGMEGRLCDSYEQALSRRGLMGFTEAERAAIDSYTAKARINAQDMFHGIRTIAAERRSCIEQGTLNVD